MARKPFMRTCDGCGLGYTEQDTRSHNAMHRRWEEASLRFGVVRTSPQLEAAKSEAHDVIHSDAPTEAKADAVAAVARAHFERSVSQFGFRRWMKHPDFDEYARAYDVKVVGLPAPEAWEEFRRRYPLVPSRHLKPGYSYWE